MLSINHVRNINYSLIQQQNTFQKQKSSRPNVVSFCGDYVGLLDIKKMKSLMEQCEYGKDLKALLSKKSGFHVSHSPSRITYENYWYQNPKNLLRKGVCGELAYNFGKKFQEIFGDKYDFKIAIGHTKKYFREGQSKHGFLLMHPKDNPDNLWIIDPSFKLINRKTKLPEYSINEVLDLDRGKVLDSSPIVNNYNKHGYTDACVIGYLKDLIPKAKKDFNPLGIVYLAIKKELNGKPRPVLCLQNNPDELIYAKDKNILEKFLRKKDVLSQYISKIKKDLEANYNLIL